MRLPNTIFLEIPNHLLKIKDMVPALGDKFVRKEVGGAHTSRPQKNYGINDFCMEETGNF